MANIYDELGLDAKEVQADAGTQGIGSLPPAGVYDATVKQAYVRKTESGAKMFAMLFDLGDKGEFFYETCTHAGDAKGNKATFGVHTMTHFLQACKLDNPAVVVGPIKHKQETIEALGIPEAAGKRIKIGLKHEENEYQGSVNLRGLISAFLTDEGKNSEGEDLAEKLAKNIEANPVKKLRASTAPKAPAAGDSVAQAAKSGW